MDFTSGLNKHIGKGAVIIYAATACMICFGFIFDIIGLSKLPEHSYLLNLVVVGICLASVLLYVFKVIRLPFSLSIIIYSALLNMVLDVYFNPFGSQRVLFFLRDSLFIVFLITIASLITNKRNGIIICMIYFGYFIALTITSKDPFLLENSLIQLSIVSAYTAVIYYFVSAFEKSILQQEKNNIKILEQNDLLIEANRLLEERQRKLEEQTNDLQEINATKDKFFSIVAHDLRSPFNGFFGLLNIMENQVATMSGKQILDFVQVMGKSAQSLYRLLENLLEWSLVQMGMSSITPSSFVLLPKIKSSLELFRESVINKKIDIEISIPEYLIVYADSRLVDSIIRNLLSNSIKFTPVGGKITLSANTIDRQFVEISIKDTGIGMSKKLQDDMFKIDVKTNRRGTEDEPSSGLGLILCKEFVEKNGGRIWIESEEGVGSVFYFTLPRKPVKKNENTTVEAIPASSIRRKKRKVTVLIAEDDLGSSISLSEVFNEEDYDLLFAFNGKKTVEICREAPYIDLILMDIEMPIMDGLEATRKIREFNQEMVIFIQTPSYFTGGKDLSSLTGFNEYLPKPVNIHELKLLVKKYFPSEGNPGLF